MDFDINIGAWKLLMCLVLFASNFLAGAATIFCFSACAGSKQAKMIATLAQCLTAGIFFGVTFMIMIPEIPLVIEAYDKKYGTVSIFINPYMHCVFGILMMMTIDAVSRAWKKSDPEVSDSDIEMSQELTEASDNPVVVVEKTKGTLMKYALFTMLLSFHSLFEGLPLGYKTDQTEMTKFFVPMLLHKLLEAFSVAAAGLNEQKKHSMLGSFIHSIMTPIGCFFGHFLVSGTPSQAMDSFLLILNGLSTGTITYIAFMEVLVDLMTNEKFEAISEVFKIVWVFIGFLVTVGMSCAIEAVEKTRSLENSLFGNATFA
ncbi:hypothetical protein GCK72_025215 [Caenorhabditis remanei]|uniref:Uncharacterized protein n=1 Tax=Caenorhabditis remanei TaxID=31234 RepID=A0A6A5G1D6_CAERE|nr:hypothetical protein GCK72_025215 [Caenorhabditis remanei]KAF1748748.1 hypothetical protein GCK72_025215 [Caenorhabditis remanei]